MLKILLCASLFIMIFMQAPVVTATTFDFVGYAGGTPGAIWLFGSVILGLIAVGKQSDT